MGCANFHLQDVVLHSNMLARMYALGPSVPEYHHRSVCDGFRKYILSSQTERLHFVFYIVLSAQASNAPSQVYRLAKDQVEYFIGLVLVNAVWSFPNLHTFQEPLRRRAVKGTAAHGL